MSAFILDESGFIQLASEMSMRAENGSHHLSSYVRKFLGTNTSDEKFDEQFYDAHPIASMKCQELYEANVRAVNARYDDFEKPIQLSFMETEPEWSDFQLFKHLQCLLYQMAEGDVYESPIYNTLEALIGRIAESILMETPEYEQTEWSWKQGWTVTKGVAA